MPRAKKKIPTFLAQGAVHSDNSPGKKAPEPKIIVEPIDKRYVTAVAVAGEDGPRHIASWRLNPATTIRPPESRKDLFRRINGYMKATIESGRAPNFSDMACAAGYSSFYQFVNATRKAVGDQKHGMARTISALCAWLEDEARAGSKNALALLQVIPQIDTHEHEASRAWAPNSPATIILLDQAEQRGRELSPAETYQQLVTSPTFEEMKPVLDTQEVDGDYEVVELPS